MYRHEVLSVYLFETLDQVREISAQWLQVYNEERPHYALAAPPPAMYRGQVITTDSSPFRLSTFPKSLHS
jgi:transposase InsO family protein